MKTRQEIKTAAKANLGGSIFANPWLMGLLVCFLSSLILSTVASFTFGLAAIFLAGPLAYGLALAFLKNSRGGELDVRDLFEGFSKDFGGTMVLGLMQSILVFLWSLLFIIPGIIKSYAYSMAFYVKVDHPEMGWQECLKESERLMNGHKMDLFVQHLSFIGWIIVGSFVCGIGTLWVSPYISASDAVFYNSLLEEQGIYHTMPTD